MYVVVKGKINDVDTNDANEQIKNLTSKKNASIIIRSIIHLSL